MDEILYGADMTHSTSLSDKALAVLAFAAYHQLGSGQAVTKVVREDGQGHRADDEAVSELQSRELVATEGNDIRFTERGLSLLSNTIEGLRMVGASGASRPDLSAH